MAAPPRSVERSRVVEAHVKLVDHMTKDKSAQEVDITKDTRNFVKLHDYFNLLALGVLNLLNVYFLATGNWFNVFLYSTVVYFLMDIAWLAVWPQSVKSPALILGHHVVTSIYILIPYIYPKYDWCMAYCMLIEINTWLLIARRNFRHSLIVASFYISWVLLRMVWYPILIYVFYKEWRLMAEQWGTVWNPLLVTPIFQTLLTGLQFQWSADLFLRKPPADSAKGKLL